MSAETPQFELSIDRAEQLVGALVDGIDKEMHGDNVALRRDEVNIVRGNNRAARKAELDNLVALFKAALHLCSTTREANNEALKNEAPEDDSFSAQPEKVTILRKVEEAFRLADKDGDEITEDDITPKLIQKIVDRIASIDQEEFSEGRFSDIRDGEAEFRKDDSSENIAHLKELAELSDSPTAKKIAVLKQRIKYDNTHKSS